MSLSTPENNLNSAASPTPVAIDTNMADPAFRSRRIAILLVLILWTLALLSFDPADIDFYAGGIADSTYPRNLIGAAGAFVGWTTFIGIGLAAYPTLALTLLCSVRRLICRRGLRRSSWAYFAAILLFAIGVSFTLALFPEHFPALASRLNIATMPGGVIGQKFCTPGEGWLQILMNTTGALVVAIAMVGTALGIIWHYDWRKPMMVALERGIDKWRREHLDASLEDDGTANDIYVQQYAQAQDTVPQTVGQPQPAAAAAPQTQTQACVNSPQLVSASGSGNFNTRREQSQQHTQATASYMPKAATPPPRQQELPQMSSAQPQPQPQPQPPPARPAAVAPVAVVSDENGVYHLPGLEYFTNIAQEGSEIVAHGEIEHNQEVIQNILDQFKIDATVVSAIPGPQVTLFEIQLGDGVLTSRLASLQSNLSMALSTPSPVRLLLPIPGKNFVGIEVANKNRLIVTARELFCDDAWQHNHMDIPLVLGRNINGECVVVDLAKAPHLLVAGSTGTGKSVCMNLMIQSMLLKFTPDDLKLIMFDPKYLEFQPYSTLPHLITRIINEPNKVGLVLRWAINEMERRYQLLSVARVKKLQEFNERPPDTEDMVDSEGNPLPKKLPFIVIIIDELADIMAHAKKEVDNALQILAAKSRAAGIHMIVATQRPDAHVITGTLKNNFPWRVALQVTDLTSSRVIMDNKGAETLLGKGDMLFKGDGNLCRIQGGMVTNSEIANVVAACSCQMPQTFDSSLELALMGDMQDGDGASGGAASSSAGGGGTAQANAPAGDDLVSRAVEILKQTKRPTISLMQRRLRIGYNKAADLIQELEDLGYIGPEPISGLREIFWDRLPASSSYSGQVAYNELDDDDGQTDDTATPETQNDDGAETENGSDTP